jgi:hypothetical protein
MWDLNFISEQAFDSHVKETINKYMESFAPMNLERFTSNIVDPIKLTFDSFLLGININQIIQNEILRQRDKANNNFIGYFHQNLFRFLPKCTVPQQGWDIIFEKDKNTKIFVELKNKHNTMNSSSAAQTFEKMTQHITIHPNDYCYLVEVISENSQKKIWKNNNSRIFRVSIDKFLSEITGDRKAFKKICTRLPFAIDKILKKQQRISIQKDSVIDELKQYDENILKALYVLSFSSYEGFDDLEE